MLMTIGGAATRDCTAYQLSAACIPLSGYVRLSPRERRAFTDGLPASFMRACYKIRQYTTECIREGVFHLSFVDLVFLSACMQLFGSRDPLACIRRPLVLGCAPSLSGVSQLLSVCFPADWLQRGATPAASPASVPRPPSCCSSPGRSSETARLSGLSSIALPCWCPSFRAVRIGGSRSVSCAVACLSTPSDYGQPVRLSFFAPPPSCRLWSMCGISAAFP